MSFVARAAKAEADRREAELVEAVKHALLCADTAEPNFLVLSGEVGQAHTKLDELGPDGLPAVQFVLDHPVVVLPQVRRASTVIQLAERHLKRYAGMLASGRPVRVFGLSVGAGQIFATYIELAHDFAGSIPGTNQ